MSDSKEDKRRSRLHEVMQKISIDDFFGQDGIMAGRWESFEWREEQLHMARAVWQNLKNGQRLAVEAGTGVGKSLAYLFPLLKFQVEGEQPAVVSTATKALQSQILEKDLPLLEELLEVEIRAELGLGSGNYVCPRRLERNSPPGADEDIDWSGFLDWEHKSESGIIADYPGFLKNEISSAINRESDHCLGRACSLYDQSYYFRARRRWENADLLILNHHLCGILFTGGAESPEICAMVVDEAHHFPSILLDVTRSELSFARLEKMLGSLTRTRGKNDTEQYTLIESSLDDEKTAKAAKAWLLEVMDVYKQLQLIVPVDLKGAFRFTTKPSFDYKTSDNFHLLQKELGSLSEDETATAEVRREAELVLRRLTEYEAGLALFISQAADRVYYARMLDEALHLYIAMTECSEVMQISSLPELGSLIFTSATLAVAHSTDYFQNELGLELDEYLELASPFDFKNQAITYLPRNMHHPSREKEAFEADVEKILPYLLEVTDGYAFVLFTSRMMLKAVYESLEEKLEEDGYTLVSQLDGGARPALRRYLEAERPVLFGLSSFWEGVDVKGDRLRHVILVKLPFQVPDEPARQARIERAEEQGRNSFMELQVPEAVIRFKQGFGRLIRSNSDHGVITVLDPRVRTQHYGKTFLQSIPQTAMAYNYSELKKSAEKCLPYRV